MEIENIYDEKQKKMINDILFEEKFIIHEPKKAKGFLSVVKSVRYGTKIFKGIGSKNAVKSYLTNKPELKILAQINDQNGYRQFVPFKSWSECLDKYKHEGYYKRYLYEVILSDRPCKPYLDIEWKQQDAYKTDYSEFITKLTNDIVKIFKERYAIRIDSKSILISTSHGDDKTSFHVVVTHLIDNKYLAYNTNRKKQSNSAWDLYLALTELDNNYYKDRLDESVYSLDREFRAIYSTKFDDYRQFVPLGWKKKKICDNILDYFITNFDKEPKYINTPVYTESKKHNNQTDFKFKNDHLINVDEIHIINRIIELLQNVHPTAFYTGKTSDNNGYRFSYRDRTEPCYSGHCHKNNGFCCYIRRLSGEVYIFCHSVKCSRIYKIGYFHKDCNWKNEIIKINQQFLDYKENINLEDVIEKEGKDEMVFCGFINKFVKNGGTYAIKSGMGTGKTQVLKKIISKHFTEKRILYLSHRQTFTQNIAGTFGDLGFYNYMDGIINLRLHDKLILQIDSIKHLLIDNIFITFDIIILDEIESLLSHFSSITLGNNRLIICKIFEIIIKKAKWILAMDADFNERSYYFLSTIKEKPKIIQNEYKSINRKYLFTTNYEMRKCQLIEDIKSNKNIVVISLSRVTLDDLYEEIIKICNKDKIIRYTSMTDDTQKEQLQEVNKYWKNYQVVMYSPTIEAGVDFNVKGHFSRMYCFLSDGSCCPRACIQMIGRIRDLFDNQIRCHCDNVMLFKGRNVYIPSIDEFEEQILHGVTTVLDFDIIDDNEIVKMKPRNIFTKLFAYNKYEDYLKQNRFIKTLKELIIIKGDTYIDTSFEKEPENDGVNVDDKIKDDDVNSTVNETGTSDQVNENAIDVYKCIDNNSTIKSSKSIYELDELLKAPKININEMKKIEEKKNKNIATRIDKLSLKRYWIEKNFKLENDEFNSEFLLTWFNKEHILFNALYALGKKPIKDPEDVYFNKTKQRLEHLRKILDIYGFRDILDFDKIVKKDDELIKRMKDSEIIIYKNYKAILSDFNKKMYKDEGENRFSLDRFTKFVNCILNEYGVRINTTIKQIKKNKIVTKTRTYSLFENIKQIYCYINRY